MTWALSAGRTRSGRTLAVAVNFSSATDGTDGTAEAAAIARRITTG
ncbi:hypothetical protein [Streptomyces sp. NPDC058953]